MGMNARVKHPFVCFFSFEKFGLDCSREQVIDRSTQQTSLRKKIERTSIQAKLGPLTNKRKQWIGKSNANRRGAGRATCRLPAVLQRYCQRPAAPVLLLRRAAEGASRSERGDSTTRRRGGRALGGSPARGTAARRGGFDERRN